MNIKDQWNRLDPITQQWLMDHPGSQILPRTITSIIFNETDGTAGPGGHGEMALSQEDRDFITAKANEAPAATEHSPLGLAAP